MIISLPSADYIRGIHQIIIEEFAVVLDTLANKHPFIDGNKRTALVTTISAYRLNGIELSYQHIVQDDFIELMLWVVDRNINKSIDDIVEKLIILINKYATNGAKLALSTTECQFSVSAKNHPDTYYYIY